MPHPASPPPLTGWRATKPGLLLSGSKRENVACQGFGAGREDPGLNPARWDAERGDLEVVWESVWSVTTSSLHVSNQHSGLSKDSCSKNDLREGLLPS